MAGRDFKAVQAAFTARLPEHHRHFLETLKVSSNDRRLFLLPCRGKAGRSLDRQIRDDLLTIREPFLSSKADHGKLVVHGHTPSLPQRFALIESELTLPPMRPTA